MPLLYSIVIWNLFALTFPSNKNNEGEFFRVYPRFVEIQLGDRKWIRLVDGKHKAFLKEWNLEKRTDNIFNVEFYKSTSFLVSIYQLNQHKLNYNITYNIKIFGLVFTKAFFCFSFLLDRSDSVNCFRFVFLMWVFVSHRLHCREISGASSSKADNCLQWTQMSG